MSSNALYKRRVRRKANYVIRILSPHMAKFIYENNPNMYLDLFGANESAMISKEVIKDMVGEKRMGVIENYANEVIVIIDLDTLDYAGDFKLIDIDPKLKTRLENLGFEFKGDEEEI